MGHRTLESISSRVCQEFGAERMLPTRTCLGGWDIATEFPLLNPGD